MSAGRNGSLLGRSSRYMESSSPSMVHRAGDSLVVRSVVSGTTLNIPGFEEPEPEEPDEDDEEDEDDPSAEDLPQCKIKRNYTCPQCNFFTQNPRTYLYHLKDEHKEKIRVYECPKCVYASKHSQKLQRHIHMVHVIGRQNQKLAKKMSPNKNAQLPPPPPLVRAGGGEVGVKVEEGGEESEEEDEDGMMMDDEDMEGMDDCGDEAEDEEDEEMMMDSSAHNSSAENDPEAGTSTEEIKCSICSFTSHSRTLVQRHENCTHLKKKFFRCSKCNYVTHMKARFTKHVKYHSMPMIKCDLCDFRTPYKWNLDRHYKNHQGDGEFKCPLCNFTADIKQSLTVHVQNHHLTPQQRLMRGMGRRNKVGASDAPAKELRMSDVGLVGAGVAHDSPPTLLPEGDDGSEDEEEEEERRADMENEDEEFQVSNFEVSPTSSGAAVASTSGLSSSPRVASSRRQPKISLTFKKLKDTERHHFDTDFIHPDDVLHKNGKVYYKNLKCSYCSFKAFWEGDILRHECKVHGVENPRDVKANQKRLARPIPNLIPLQQQQQTPPAPGTSVLRSRRSSTSSQAAEAISEQDLNDICAKSSNSALKDFASLIGAAFPLEERSTKAGAEQKPEAEELGSKEPKSESGDPKLKSKDPNLEVDEPKQDSEIDNKTEDKPDKEKSPPPQHSTSPSKKKNGSSFFDKLKETLIGQEASNLVCEVCGHESKCLSEAVCHKKIHKDEKESTSSANQRMIGLVGLSSTRCQHCRHRCKTSADLLVHLQSCLNRDSTSSGQDDTQEAAQEEEEEEPPQCPNCEQRFDTEDDLAKHLDYCKPRLELNPEVSITEVKPLELHPMENKVFVWNQFTADTSPEEVKPALTIERIPSASRPEQSSKSLEDSEEEREDTDGEDEEDSSLVGVETAPGFGSVTNQKGRKPSDEASHVQKVYKCPQCAFWASAASRFHIHLVGHLNRKPFGCSQCEYRSNWRWDVAKHIRLKGARDANHAAQSRPRVVVNDDDTSRRNYSKYNKFLTLMSVRLGQTQSDSPPPPALPAPPRLIPAPSIESANPRQQTLRPPPPLRAATQHVLSQLANSEDGKRGVKRPLPSEDKTPEPGTKRLLWRCKKCNFRGLNKELVLAHVRTHYQTVPSTPATSGPPQLTPAVQVSKSGDGDGGLACDKCPFVGRWVGELRAHQQHHVPQPGAIFKCYLCPFYVGTKRELLNHMRIHGVNEPEDHLSRTLQAKMAASSSKPETDEDGSCDNSPGGSKRYKCGSCPYETNARGQFVYHQQLHSTGSIKPAVTPTTVVPEESSPEGPPFRCKICSYTVAKRHLLHQHLRVHGIVVPPARVSPASSSNPAAVLPPLDTSRAKDVPLVWVVKKDKFLKMFKCRFCPHVNLRKVNIQEHEKMHKSRKGQVATTADPSGMVHRCSQCTYQCNNAGVLSAHAKVHLEWYPRSCAMVDALKSDDVQLKELGGEMADVTETEDGELPDSGPHQDAAGYGNGQSERSTPSSSQHHDDQEDDEEDTRLLYFCRQCPARFLFSRELAIHRRFHRIRLQHHCPSCNYTARQPSHLQAHAKVHTQEYQDRTMLLGQQHQMSQEHSRPFSIFREGVWTVPEDQPPLVVPKATHNLGPGPHKQYSCHRCPARFFKSVALSYHLSLHGGPGPYKCQTCDYAVKMYGNLVRHEPVHAKEINEDPKPIVVRPVDHVPVSGTELFQQREAQKMGNGVEYQDHDMQPPQAPIQPQPHQQILTVDPVFGTLMHGNPKFVYPTYIKNGKMKEKRYKCHKCPSAFEKREQYKVHLSLHGSRQKYRCDRCDYSVKYYANFIQHIRKHKHNDDVRQASAEGVSENGSPSPDEEMVLVPPSVQRSAGKSIGQSSPSPSARPGSELLAVERQQMLIRQRRKAVADDTLEDETISIVPSYWCPHCPYNSMRKDGVETHSKRHLCNNPGIKTTFLCVHCDYSAPQSHFLREHNKLHFRWKLQPPGRRPETFMRGEQLELWSQNVDKENEERRLVFQDKGRAEKDQRFLPDVLTDETSDEGEDDDIFYDLRTGEVVVGELERLRAEEKETLQENPAEGSTEQPTD